MVTQGLLPASEVVLRDGSTVRLRELTAEDRSLVRDLLAGLSGSARATRFFSAGVDLDTTAELLVQVDGRRSFGLLALQGDPPRPLAHAICISTSPGRAEVAFTVADDFQRRGLASIMLAQLAEAANRIGIGVFEAAVLPENAAMLEVFANSGFTLHTDSQPGSLALEFATEITPGALSRFLEREEEAASAAVEAILAPGSVAVIGASRQRGTIGGEVFHNLLEYGFQGPVYPVNPGAAVVQSVPAYPTVTAIPGPVDLAVVCVPAAAVNQVARQCVDKQVKALVVISAGFAEGGAEGRARQAELLYICGESGMRLVGPNCMGALNTAPDVRLNATFAPTMPIPGPIGFLSQSGALGLAIIESTRTLGLGLSSFISVGNKADISSNDLLSFWGRDDRTEVVALYLESFGNPRKFAQIAARVAREKPIVAVRSGKGRAGARAAASHTASLVAASDSTVDALFRQTGVLRTETLSDLFDLLAMLSTQPLPRGPRMALITNSGGPAILCSDALEANSLEVAELAASTRERLRTFLPEEAATGNPVDMIASASADDYRRAIGVVSADPAVDALVVIFTPPLVTRAEDVAQAIREAAASLPRGIPIVSVFMTSEGVPEALRSGAVQVPSYPFPENPARVLAAALRLQRWRERPRREGSPSPAPDQLRVAAALADWLRGGPRWLSSAETAELLSAYGLQVVPTATAQDPAEAGARARELGFPLVLKGSGPTILHKTELGAVRLGLRTEEEVRAAAAEMRARLADEGHVVETFLLQPQLEAGVELLVGAVRDRQFGTVVACGAGGTAVELLNDTSIRLAPVSREEASEMLSELGTYPLLTGFRGAPVTDLEAAAGALAGVAALAEDHPALAELECNPLVVTPKGAFVVDARARLEAPPPELPTGAKRFADRGA